MAIPKPHTSPLKVVMSERGQMRLLYQGKPLPGVARIECDQDGYAGRAEVRVTFVGCAVGLETEPPLCLQEG